MNRNNKQQTTNAMKLTKIKQKSKLYFRDYIFFSGGKLFAVCKGKVYQLMILKFQAGISDSTDVLELHGYRTQSARVLGSDEFKRPEPSIRVSDMGSSTEYEVEGVYYVEDEGKPDKKGKKEYSTIKQSNPELFDYLLVFVCTNNDKEIIIPQQMVEEREVAEREQPEFLEIAPPKFTEMEVSGFILMIGEKIEETPVSLEDLTNTKQVEVTEDGNEEDEDKDENKKIETFDPKKKFKTQSGKVLVAEGKNLETGSYFGAWEDSGELAEVPTEEILEEIAETAAI